LPSWINTNFEEAFPKVLTNYETTSARQGTLSNQYNKDIGRHKNNACITRNCKLNNVSDCKTQHEEKRKGRHQEIKPWVLSKPENFRQITLLSRQKFPKFKMTATKDFSIFVRSYFQKINETRPVRNLQNNYYGTSPSA
jgi:hypothetical protein